MKEIKHSDQVLELAKIRAFSPLKHNKVEVQRCQEAKINQNFLSFLWSSSKTIFKYYSDSFQKGVDYIKWLRKSWSSGWSAHSEKGAKGPVLVTLPKGVMGETEVWTSPQMDWKSWVWPLLTSFEALRIKSLSVFQVETWNSQHHFWSGRDFS